MGNSKSTTSAVPSANTGPYAFLLKTVLVGDACVGKSVLAHRGVHKEEAPYNPPDQRQYLATIGCQPFVYSATAPDGQSMKLQVWDLAGDPRFSHVITALPRGASGVMVVFDCTRRDTFEHVPRWVATVCQEAPSALFLLVGTKIDVRDAATVASPAGHVSAHVSSAEGHQLAAELSMIGYVELNAIASDGREIDAAFTQLREAMFYRIRDPIPMRPNLAAAANSAVQQPATQAPAIASDNNATNDGHRCESTSGVHVDNATADRRLAQRLAALSADAHAAIKVTMPPPTAESLEARLAQLNGPVVPAPDEAELQRRFEKLHGGGGGSSSSSASVAPISLYSAADLQLPQARRTEQEEVDDLLAQMQEQHQLESGQQPLAKPSPSLAAAAPASASTSSSTTAPHPLGVASPPPPTKSEIESLMRDLNDLPDTEILAQAHRYTQAAKAARGGKPSQLLDESDQDTSEGEDEDDDARVNDIINQARDEARMGF